MNRVKHCGILLPKKGENLDRKGFKPVESSLISYQSLRALQESSSQDSESGDACRY